MNFSANFHVDLPVVLEHGANDHTIIVSLDDGGSYKSPIAYIYLPQKYTGAVAAGIAAFNEAFNAALEQEPIKEAAE